MESRWFSILNDEISVMHAQLSLLNRDEIVGLMPYLHDRSLFYVPRFQDDAELVSVFISKGGRALQFASPRLRADPELALKACVNNPYALEYVSNELKFNRAFFTQLVKACPVQNINILCTYAPGMLDTALSYYISEICNNEPGQRCHAVFRLVQWDEPLAATALRANSVYDLLPVELKRNQRLAEMAFKFDWRQFIDAPTEFRANRALAYTMVAESGMCFKWLEKDLQDDAALLHLAISSYARAFASASPQLRGNKQLALQAVKVNGLLLEYASLAVQQDADVVLAAVIQEGTALKFAATEFRRHKLFVTIAVATAGFNVFPFQEPGGLFNQWKEEYKEDRTRMFIFLMGSRDTGSTVRKLNHHGIYFAFQFKMSIAGFLGAAYGNTYKFVLAARAASRNAVFGYNRPNLPYSL